MSVTPVIQLMLRHMHACLSLSVKANHLIYDVEWWRNKFCGRSSGFEGVCRLSLTAEGSEEGIWILYQSVHQEGIHARMCPALWGIMGGGSAKHENSLTSYHLYYQAYLWRAYYSFITGGVMYEQSTTCCNAFGWRQCSTYVYPGAFPHWLPTGGYSWFSSILQSLISLLIATLSVSTTWFLEEMVN